MIKSFRHKGLEKLYSTGSASGVRSDHKNRLKMQLTALDTAMTIDDMQIPGFRLHPLKGKRVGYWAITVNRNWRLTFRFEDGDVFDMNYEDYH